MAKKSNSHKYLVRNKCPDCKCIHYTKEEHPELILVNWPKYCPECKKNQGEEEGADWIKPGPARRRASA